MFDAAMTATLGSPLSRAAVRTRAQSGRSFSYLEGWHIIAEANRIFGFGAWNRETIDIKCVAEKAREVGAQKAPGWAVTYISKVRISVGATVREGCGSGHGIDRDLGQAHESAIKEAETDAMKRAFMTFGNQFGLALYDKEQTNVADVPDPSTLRFIEENLSAIGEFQDEKELRAWWDSPEQKQARRDFGLSSEDISRLLAAIKTRIAKIKESK